MGGSLTILVFLLFLGGCGSDINGGETYEQEVNGPAGSYTGATEFVPGMFAASQAIYLYDEKSLKWIGITFDPDGGMLYEGTDGIGVESTYTIANGKMFVTGTHKNATVTLNRAKATTFEVTREENENSIQQDKWYLELKFKTEMLEGKCYLSKYNDRGEAVSEKVCFSKTALNIYTLGGALKHSDPYSLKDNIIVLNSNTGKFSLRLMFIDAENRLNVWYVSESENYANNATWTEIK